MRITFLSGGCGTPKLIEGFRRIVGDENITVITNISDNFWWNGLYICPDIDTVTYLFADMLDTSKYWGIRGDTFNFLNFARTLGIEMDWFNIGDKDLAIHVVRTYLLKKGYRLYEITKYITSRLGIKAKILPASNDEITTYVLTPRGEMHIQEYLVKYRSELEVYGIVFKGLNSARPAPEVIESLKECDIVIIGPSNPVNSIGPIVKIREVYETLREVKSKVIAISPLIRGKPLKGPADKFMRALGYEASPIGLVEMFRDVINVIIIDVQDEAFKDLIEDEFNVKVYVTNTIMNTLDDKIRFSREIYNLCKAITPQT